MNKKLLATVLTVILVITLILPVSATNKTSYIENNIKENTEVLEITKQENKEVVVAADEIYNFSTVTNAITQKQGVSNEKISSTEIIQTADITNIAYIESDNDVVEIIENDTTQETIVENNENQVVEVEIEDVVEENTTETIITEESTEVIITENETTENETTENTIEDENYEDEVEDITNVIEQEETTEDVVENETEDVDITIADTNVDISTDEVTARTEYTLKIESPNHTTVQLNINGQDYTITHTEEFKYTINNLVYEEPEVICNNGDIYKISSSIQTDNKEIQQVCIVYRVDVLGPALAQDIAYSTMSFDGITIDTKIDITYLAYCDGTQVTKKVIKAIPYDKVALEVIITEHPDGTIEEVTNKIDFDEIKELVENDKKTIYNDSDDYFSFSAQEAISSCSMKDGAMVTELVETGNVTINGKIYNAKLYTITKTIETEEYQSLDEVRKIYLTDYDVYIYTENYGEYLSLDTYASSAMMEEIFNFTELINIINAE